MSPERAAITGVVLAGGRGQRMGGADKGLIPYRGQPLASYALAALQHATDHILINANRNASDYQEFGYPVIPDLTSQYDGPLAGLLSAMRAAATPWVLTVPCDVPHLTGPVLQRLIEQQQTSRAAIVVADDGERLHPVILLARTTLADNLSAYLAAGQRKVEQWIRQQDWQAADLSDVAASLLNINTEDELNS